MIKPILGIKKERQSVHFNKKDHKKKFVVLNTILLIYFYLWYYATIKFSLCQKSGHIRAQFPEVDKIPLLDALLGKTYKMHVFPYSTMLPPSADGMLTDFLYIVK